MLSESIFNEDTYIENMYLNKFEVPLTTEGTEEIFDNITHGSVYSKFIQSVYMPVHSIDGGSGRPFSYEYSPEEYYSLIRRILTHKPIVITFPTGDPEVLRKYLDIGVKEFMVSRWDDRYYELKKEYEGVQIHRSIVDNSYNDEIDERFDKIVMPYKRLLDIDWIKENHKKTKLVALVNHICKIACPMLDDHPGYTCNSEEKDTPHICPPGGRDVFIPRQVLNQILEYIDTVKLIERTKNCFYYEVYIDYYTKGKLPSSARTEDPDKIRKFYNNTIVHKLYDHSNLVNLNCKFECRTCDKKCY